jgi:hypothetical protein
MKIYNTLCYISANIFLLIFAELCFSGEKLSASNNKCLNIFEKKYNHSSLTINSRRQEELVVLNGIYSSDDSQKIRANRKNKLNDKLNFSLEFNWNNQASKRPWWTVAQKLSPTAKLSKLDQIQFDVFLSSANDNTHFRIFLEESDGDRWIVSDLNFNKDLRAGFWKNFVVKREQMKPWLLGDKRPDWKSIRTVVIEPWSSSTSNGRAIFSIDRLKLTGPGMSSLDVFNTEDDGDWSNLDKAVPMQALPTPGVIYLPGVGRGQLSNSATPSKFKALLGRIGTTHAFDSNAENLINKKIPLVGYTALLEGYEKYLTRRNAWDVNAFGEGPGNTPLLEKQFTYFHTFSHAHAGVSSALQHRIDAMVKSGIGIFMAVDYVLPWRQGPFGYSEAMLAAYRDDLKALDTGLLLTEGHQTKLIHFPEYFRLYHGFFPKAQDLSLADWSKFTPPQPNENKANIRAYWRLFSFLRSYEWLKLAGRTGRYMQCRGGHGLWVIPNPEDSQGSPDYSMLLRTAGVTNVFPEWFGRIATMSSAAYYSGPYLREQANHGKSRLSALFETGSGGHAAPYWDWQNAFNGVYSLTAATQADDFDNDFIDRAPFEEMNNPKTNPTEFIRFRDTVSKAFGFQLAKEQKAKRNSSDMLYVTDRSPLNVSSMFFTNEEKTRPGLIGSLWRSHAIFDVRDSLELEKVLERYETIFYSVISPRNGDFAHLQAWLKKKPGRLLVTHSFIPTRNAQGYWNGDSGTKYGSIQNSFFGIGSIKQTNPKQFKITSVNNIWKDFVNAGKTFSLAEPLSRTEYGKPLINSSAGAVVSKTLVGGSEVIYLHYTPGYSQNTRSLDREIAKAILKERQQKSLALSNADVSVQMFNVSGGKSIILWDMQNEESWAKGNESYRTSLPWRSKSINHTILIPAKGKQKVYDFWSDKIMELTPKKGYISLELTGVTSKLYFLGSNTESFNKTIRNTQSVRKKIKFLNFEINLN